MGNGKPEYSTYFSHFTLDVMPLLEGREKPPKNTVVFFAAKKTFDEQDRV